LKKRIHSTEISEKTLVSPKALFWEDGKSPIFRANLGKRSMSPPHEQPELPRALALEVFWIEGSEVFEISPLPVVMADSLSIPSESRLFRSTLSLPTFPKSESLIPKHILNHMTVGLAPCMPKALYRTRLSASGLWSLPDV
jgi:hypothetical protein